MPRSEDKLRIAVLITCHNRCAHTRSCLLALKQQQAFGGSLDIFIVDDGSSDGTDQAIVEVFPHARLLKGDGNFYWAGGTRWAFAEAMLEDYDFYLWLNDDTQLDPDALARLHRTYHDASAQLGEMIIVIGSTYAEGEQTMTYGGWRLSRKPFSLVRWKKAPPRADRWTTCDTMNGNCVFISRAVMKVNGNIDTSFTHSMGDLDYGLRAQRVGCQIVIAPGYYGFCSQNDGAGLWTDERLSVRERWKRLLGPKGLPVAEWKVFTRRHAGWLWPVNWLGPYLKFWLIVLARKLGFKQ